MESGSSENWQWAKGVDIARQLTVITRLKLTDRLVWPTTRKRIESVFSVITQKFLAYIHAVTAKAFEMKVFLFILTYGIEKAMI